VGRRPALQVHIPAGPAEKRQALPHTDVTLKEGRCQLSIYGEQLAKQF
jgi:hypothetical protein